MTLSRTKYLPLLALLFAAVIVAGCTKSGGHNYDKEIYKPKYASGFFITGADGSDSRLITVSNPWQGADSVYMSLLVLAEGDEAPAGFDGQVLKGPAQRVVCTSSSHVAMLDAIGAADRIVGVSGIDFISNKNVQSRKGEIADIGYDGAYDYESLVGADPDLVLLYGVTGASGLEGKLRELGIPYMYVGEYVEEDPLGKAEWVVPLAVATGLADKGKAVFEAIPPRYEAVKKRVADVAARPVVMLNTPYRDQWFMPSASSYMVRLVNDAEATYAYNKNTGNTSVPIDMEEAYALTDGADFWINTGTYSTLPALRAAFPKLADTGPFVNRRVFNNNRLSTANGGNDFYESSVVHPDLVLRDLVKIFHPDLVPEDFVYYQRLAD